MVKKIKFPLEMEMGVKVRTLEELRENFNVQKIISYYIDGKLQIWLRDRYYDNEYAQIAKLDSKEKDFKRRLLEALGINYICSEEIDVDKLEQQSKKIAQLKEYTDDEHIIHNINNVVFNQEELMELLKSKTSKIYLCGEEFSIPSSKEGITYIGIDKPKVNFEDVSDLNLDKKNITFDNVHITSKSNIRIVAQKSRQITIDTNKIKVDLSFEHIISTIDISKNDSWYDKKIYLYKELIIIISPWEFEIYTIYGKEKIVSFDDIKRENWAWYSKARIDVSQIYKNYIIMFFGKHDSGGNSKLMIFNLDTLKVEKIVVTPEGHDGNSNVCAPDYIDVYDNNIVLYQKLSIDGYGGHRIKYQFHKFPNCDDVRTGSLWVEEIKYHKAMTFGNVYLGHIYRFSPLNMKIMSTSKEYNCKGFYKDGGSRNCTIGKFIIYSDKLITTHCEESASHKQHYESSVDIGKFSVYDINGGYPLKTVTVSDKKITNFIHVENSIVVWGKESNEVFFYNDNNFELLNKISLDLSLGIWSKSSSWVCDVYIDPNTRRMAISYNGIVAIYE